MTFVAGASTIPVAIAMVVALACFAGWAVLMAGQSFATPIRASDTADDAPDHTVAHTAGKTAGETARETVAPDGTAAATSPQSEARPTAAVDGPTRAVHAIVGPHYRVAAPDDDTVAAAMAHRVPRPRPDLRLVVSRRADQGEEIPRSA